MDKFFKLFVKLFPSGDVFYLAVEKNLTKFIRSLTALPNDFRTYINNVYLDIFPDTTRSLKLWCETFGLSGCSSEENARLNLDTSWKAQGGQGWEYIQGILQTAGFNVQIHENNPPIDPDILLSSTPWMVAGGQYAYAGNDNAVAGKTGGDLLVNGDIQTVIPLYESICGAPFMSCGNEGAHAGYYTKTTVVEKVYTIPNDPNLWGAFFFIGGDVTRDPITNEITNIQNVDIPAERKQEFLTQILKLKPAQTWVGLLVSYV